MTEPESHTLTRRQLALGCAIFAVLGMLAMAYFNAFELTSGSRYHRDLTQSPHWIAHHGDAFPEDDLLVRYGRYNESPVQNLVYWAGTFLVDVVTLEKLVGIVIFGMTAALFFGLVGATSGLRAGVLAASFFIILPRSTYEIAGGFSKAWAIGFVLVAVHVVETRRWPILVWTMPFAALAYPVSPVLMGAIALAGIGLEVARSRQEAVRGLTYLSAGSALAIAPLLYKYFTPPEFVGEMISSADLREEWESGISSDGPDPLWEEVLDFVEEPFFVLGAIVLCMLLGPRGLTWQRGWTALALASAAFFLVAEAVVPRLYMPDRYIRYSMAVLLVLWHAHNWGRALDRIGHRAVRYAALAVLLVVAALSFPDTFTACDGDKSHGVWEDRDFYAPIAAAVAEEPLPVLVAGHPTDLACIMVQSRRPVLAVNRMYHRWFETYRETIDERHRDIFRAIYARDVEDVNRLTEEYGVTHILVRKTMYLSTVRRTGGIYKREYEQFIKRIAAGPPQFILCPPPSESVMYEDDDFWLARLPLPPPPRRRPWPDPSRRDDRRQDADPNEP